MVTFVRELPRTATGALQALVKCGDDYYVVSSISGGVHRIRPETLVFESDRHGVVTDFLDIAGGPGMTRDEAIEDLAVVLSNKER